MKRLIIALCVIAFSITFSIMENIYFGWNVFPKSFLEFICDTICMLGFGICYLLLISLKRKQ